MKVDMGQKLKDLTGKAITNEEMKLPLTLGDTCQQALLFFSTTEDTPEKKLCLYRLSVKIEGSKEQVPNMPPGVERFGHVDLDTSEIQLIEEMSGRQHMPLVYGQVYEMLEGKASA